MLHRIHSLIQLSEMVRQNMCGVPCIPPAGATILRFHWRYVFEDGSKKARNCCDGSLKVAPQLHAAEQTYSPVCVSSMPYVQTVPVRGALQGHPASGALWERAYNAILHELGFKSTAHERNLFHTTINGHLVLLCRQVDDMPLLAPTLPQPNWS